MFGKIVDGELILAPKILTVDDRVYYNPNDKMYLDMGYLPVEYSLPDITDETGELVSSFVEKDGEIVQIWEEKEAEEAELDGTPTLEDRVTELEIKVDEIIQK